MMLGGAPLGGAPFGSVLVDFLPASLVATPPTLAGYSVPTPAVTQVHRLDARRVIGSDLFGALDFGTGWTTAGTVTPIDADSFSVSGAGGLYKSFGLVTGKNYRVVVAFTQSGSSPTFSISNTSGLFSPQVSPVSSEPSGSFDFIFTASNANLYFRTSGGTVNITSITLYEVSSEGISLAGYSVPTPALSVIYNLTATPPTRTWGTWPTPAITQVHSLVATPPTRTWGTWPTPALTQVHNLTATPPTRTWGTWPTPALTQVHLLTATPPMLGEFGPNIIVNGDFAGGTTGWTGFGSNGWSVVGGAASKTAGLVGNLIQSILADGETYKAVLTVVMSAGGLAAYAGHTGSFGGIFSSGTYTRYAVESGDNNFYIQGNAAFVGTVDNVSVYRLYGYKVDTPALTAATCIATPPTLAGYTVGTPAITQVHNLTATPPTRTWGTWPTPALTQVHNLTATPPTRTWATWPTPALTQVHNLTATPPTRTWATWPTPVLTQVHRLTATPPTRTWATWPTPALNQVYTLVATPPTLQGYKVPSPGPALTQIHGLSAISLTIGGYVVATPKLRSGTFRYSDGAKRQLGLMRVANSDGEWKDARGMWLYKNGRWQRIYTA